MSHERRKNSSEYCYTAIKNENDLSYRQFGQFQQYKRSDKLINHLQVFDKMKQYFAFVLLFKCLVLCSAEVPAETTLLPQVQILSISRTSNSLVTADTDFALNVDVSGVLKE